MSRVIAVLLAGALLAAPAVAHAADELSTTDRLEDRRYVAAGERAYVMGFEDGSFQAQGWHIGGEMGGVWSQPLKLVDGLWFGIGDTWAGPATRFTSGWGHVRLDLPTTDGLTLSRTDFAPDGRRAALFGLRVRNPGKARTVRVKVDARSELMSHYPWTWTTPSADAFNLQDDGEYDPALGALVFREDGRPHPNAPEHHWAAVVGSNVAPVSGTASEDAGAHWGAQAPVDECRDEGVPDEQKAFTCDDGSAGKGAGGQLAYDLALPRGGERTLWIAVAGSEEGRDGAVREFRAALADPAGALAAKVAAREKAAGWTQLSLPGDPLLARGVEWGKQNLLDSTQRADGLRIRDVDEGRAYPPPAGTVASARWLGAGFPDYPWLFATDGAYTAFASVAVGQFEAITDHAEALRAVSLILNGDSGKVAHEVVADGSVYYGNLADEGNTDETAKFPSMVALLWRWTGDDGFRDRMYAFARSNARYIMERLDSDGDGWPEGLGNVERPGMGEEKLDNTVSTIRMLFDLADMADAKGDNGTEGWALARGRDLLRRFEQTWWMPEARQYADSLDDPGNVRVQQKHWIGVTPMEVELVQDGRVVPGLADREHGVTALRERETPCYSGERPFNRGLFHTGCNGGPEGKGELDIFSLNTAVMAVGEGNFGRLGPEAQGRYTEANRELMLPAPDEQPGAMPEIAPSPPPRGRNIDRCTRCRSMVMQAWGNYGTAWPVVHHQLGVRPDLGRATLEVVPQLPSSAPVQGTNVRLGRGAIDVRASRDGATYRTELDTGDVALQTVRVGHTVPHGTRVSQVSLDGRVVQAERRTTSRGLELTVATGPGRHVLEVTG
jgi:hypothetical protein